MQYGAQGADGPPGASSKRRRILIVDDNEDAVAMLRALPWGGDVLLVALTGWGHEVDRRRTQEAGFDRHLLKPADRASIESVLAEFAGVS